MEIGGVGAVGIVRGECEGGIPHTHLFTKNSKPHQKFFKNFILASFPVYQFYFTYVTHSKIIVVYYYKAIIMGFIDIFDFGKYIKKESDQTLARYGHVNALRRYVDDLISNISNGTNGLRKNANYFDFSSNSVTAFSGVGVWTKLVTNTNSLYSDQGWVLSNNRLTWNGDGPIRIKMEGIASISSSTNGQEIHFAFFIGEGLNPPSLYPCSEQSALIPPAGANKSQAVPFHCVAEIEPGDFLETWVKNSTSAISITLLNINVIVSNW